MKSFITSLIIAIIIISSSFFFTHSIEKTSKKLLKDNREIIELIENNDYENAYSLTKDMQEYVNKKKISLAVIMDHGDLDKIESSIAELESYIDHEIKSDALAKCNTLDVIIRHMPKNYKLKIENVL